MTTREDPMPPHDPEETTGWVPVPYGLKENPGVWDTGNGAIRYVDEHPDYPGIERVTVRSYCGRDTDNCRFYRLAVDTRQDFDTLEDALAAL